MSGKKPILGFTQSIHSAPIEVSLIDKLFEFIGRTKIKQKKKQGGPLCKTFSYYTDASFFFGR
jgi:hypothetical protein